MLIGSKSASPIELSRSTICLDVCMYVHKHTYVCYCWFFFVVKLVVCCYKTSHSACVSWTVAGNKKNENTKQRKQPGCTVISVVDCMWKASRCVKFFWIAGPFIWWDANVEGKTNVAKIGEHCHFVVPVACDATVTWLYMNETYARVSFPSVFSMGKSTRTIYHSIYLSVKNAICKLSLCFLFWTLLWLSFSAKLEGVRAEEKAVRHARSLKNVAAIKKAKHVQCKRIFTEQKAARFDMPHNCKLHMRDWFSFWCSIVGSISNIGSDHMAAQTLLHSCDSTLISATM